MKNLNWSFGGERFQISTDTFPGLADLFSQVAYCYYLSAKKSGVIKATSLSQNSLDLIKRYLNINQISPKIVDIPKKIPKLEFQFELDDSKHVVFLTSGKDSVHLLQTIVGKFGAQNVLAIYVDRLNKSEAVYESKNSEKIAAHFGVKYHRVEVVNSIKLNRDGHNIGLRDQMILVSALSEIFNFRASNVWYGVTHDEQPPSLWTETYDAHVYIQQLIWTMYGVKLSIHFHCENGVHELDIIREIVQDRALLDMTSSCYSQQNFREHKHDSVQRKFPKFPFYNGCGSCVKCMRINGGILAFTHAKSVSYAAEWILKAQEFKADETINRLRPLVTNILEGK